MTPQPSLDSASRSRQHAPNAPRSLLCSAAPQSRARSRLGSSLVCLSILDLLYRAAPYAAQRAQSRPRNTHLNRTRDLGHITGLGLPLLGPSARAP
ncbi:hypothetical protein VTO73DRAFT_14002 [Trametes versicolor]